jgi:hypothetical protein
MIERDIAWDDWDDRVLGVWEVWVSFGIGWCLGRFIP